MVYKLNLWRADDEDRNYKHDENDMSIMGARKLEYVVFDVNAV